MFWNEECSLVGTATQFFPFSARPGIDQLVELTRWDRRGAAQTDPARFVEQQDGKLPIWNVEVGADGVHLSLREQSPGGVERRGDGFCRGHDRGKEHEAIHHVVGVGVENVLLRLESGVVVGGAKDQQGAPAEAHFMKVAGLDLAVEHGLSIERQGQREERHQKRRARNKTHVVI